MLISSFILGVCGFGLSAYAFFLEYKISRDPTYKPICDLSDAVSCSKPVLSPYGKLFGISNALIGIVFYAAVCTFAFAHAYTLLLYASIAACVVSLYLAGVLYTKIRVFCLVCTALYCINGLLFLVSYMGW